MPTITTKPFLILTSFAGYDIPALRPFVLSWRRHCPQHDLIALVDGLRPETCAWLEACGARLHPCPLPRFQRPSGIFKAMEKHGLRIGAAALDLLDHLLGGKDPGRSLRRRNALLDLSALRFSHYRDILNIRGPDYACVALLDGRDSVFQRPLDPVSGIQAYAEHDLIGGSHFAKRWFQMTYGLSQWRALRARPFLCSGAIVGDTGSILSFLARQTEHCARQVALFGEDQAVFNYLVHHGLVPATIHALGEGQTVNLNACPLEQLRISNGLLMAADDRPYAVVHQYDRVVGLAEKLQAVHYPDF